MTYAGVSHLTFNRTEFVAQVPMWLRFNEGFTDFVVLASGVVEILLGLSMIFLFKKKATVGASCDILCADIPWQLKPVFLPYRFVWTQY